MYQAKFQVPHRPEQEIDEYKKELHFSLSREFKAIEAAISKQTTTTVFIGGGGSGGGSSGGGGGTGTKLALVVTQVVTGPADITVSFPALSTASYGVISILQNSTGDFSFGQPKQPPLADSRSLTQVTVTVQESGTLRSFIILE